MKKWVLAINKKIKLINVFIFLGIMLAFFLIDWLTKYFLFDMRAANDYYWVPIEQDFKLFGIRSLAHDNSTIFSFLKFKSSVELRLSLNSIIIILFLIWGLFCSSIPYAIGLGIITGGMFGNVMDVAFTDGKIFTHYVRDIFYLPWFDRGTFNLADTFIVVGAIIIFVVTIVDIWNQREKKVEALEKTK